MWVWALPAGPLAGVAFSPHGRRWEGLAERWPQATYRYHRGVPFRYFS